MLRAAGHVDDFARGETDPPAQLEQEIGVVGDRRFRLRFELDQGVAQAVPEGVPLAKLSGGCSMLKCECIMAPPTFRSR